MDVTPEAGDPSGTEGLSARSPDATFLSALQVSDTFFPTGLYTLSHGFEAFVQAGLVSTANVEALLRDYLESVLGPADGVALAHAHRATEEGDLGRLLEVDRRLLAMKLVREARESSRRVGKRILATAVTLAQGRVLVDYRSAVDGGACPGNAAVALGVAAATLGIPRREAMLIELHTFSTGLLGVAMRLCRLDHVEAQRILARLQPLMVRVVRESIDKPIQEMRAFAPLIDVMGMMHERAHVRLFVS